MESGEKIVPLPHVTRVYKNVRVIYYVQRIENKAIRTAEKVQSVAPLQHKRKNLKYTVNEVSWKHRSEG